jgi:hypothetical protein
MGFRHVRDGGKTPALCQNDTMYAGYFLHPPYSNYGKVLYGDSLESLSTFDEPIDLFINDSDHSEEYEQAEYEIIKSKISPTAIVLGDNSHVTPKLAEFSMREGRRFVFLSEEPANHWYRGCGVGISLPKLSEASDKREHLVEVAHVDVGPRTGQLPKS